MAAIADDLLTKARQPALHPFGELRTEDGVLVRQHNKAYAELQRVAGAQLDPELVKAFGRVISAPEGATAAAIAPI